MSYTVNVAPVRKDLRALDETTRRRIIRAVMARETNPHPTGVKKLQREEGIWRLRVGDSRVLYTIQDQELVILVLYCQTYRYPHRCSGFFYTSPSDNNLFIRINDVSLFL